MTVPKLTWEDYKDKDGNWLQPMTSRQVITAQAERIAALTDAGDRLVADLILLRVTGALPDDTAVKAWQALVRPRVRAS